MPTSNKIPMLVLIMASKIIVIIVNGVAEAIVIVIMPQLQ